MPSYVITGASRGIGYGFITALAKQPGNTVIGLVRNKAATEAKLASDGITNVHVITADIADYTTLSSAAASVSQITGGSLDYLINNAALVHTDFAALPDYAPAELDKVLSEAFHVNVTGIAHTTNAFLPLIRKGSAKKVITISSGFADQDLALQLDLHEAPFYSMTKAAANMLMAKYAALLGKQEGILFLSLSPGAVDTSVGRPEPMTEEELEAARGMFPKFMKYAPEWKGMISVEESVEMCLKVIGEASVESMGGGFVSHFGNKQWL